VLQCVAVCCSVLPRRKKPVLVVGSPHGLASVLQCVAVCCSVLQCVALHCIVLQCVATTEETCPGDWITAGASQIIKSHRLVICHSYIVSRRSTSQLPCCLRCLYTHTHTHIHTHTHTHRHTQTYIYINMYIYIYTYTYTELFAIRTFCRRKRTMHLQCCMRCLYTHTHTHTQLESSTRNYYIISPRVIINAIIITHTHTHIHIL